MSKLFREGGPSGSGKRWEWIDRSTTADGRLIGLFGLSKRLLFFLSGDFFSIKNTMMGAGKRILGQSQSEGSKRNSAPVHHAKSWKVQSKATSFRCSPSTVRALSTHPPRHIPLPSRPLHNWAPKLVLFLSHLHLHLQNTHTHIVWNCLKLFEKGQGLGLVHLFRLFLHVSCVSWIQFIVQYLTGVELSCPWWNRVQRLVVLAWGALSCMWWHVSALSLRRVLTSVFLLYAIWQSHWNGMLLAQVWLFKANIS